MEKNIQKAKDRFDAAKKALLAEVVKTYPIGTIIEVELGRAIVRGSVVHHTYSHNEILVKNTHTGKVRRVNVTFDPVRIIR